MLNDENKFENKWTLIRAHKENRANHLPFILLNGLRSHRFDCDIVIRRPDLGHFVESNLGCRSGFLARFFSMCKSSGEPEQFVFG